VAVINDHPRGHKNLFLRKRLDESNSPGGTGSPGVGD